MKSTVIVKLFYFCIYGFFFFKFICNLGSFGPPYRGTEKGCLSFFAIPIMLKYSLNIDFSVFFPAIRSLLSFVYFHLSLLTKRIKLKVTLSLHSGYKPHTAAIINASSYQ